MTNEEEAIKNLKKLKSFHNGSYGTAIDLAIKALEQQPCEDCISRQAVIRLVEQYPTIIGNRCSGLIADIKHLPSVTPKPKMGRWIRRDYWSEGVGMGENYGYYYQCSECKEIIQGGYIKCDDKYCPNCGAKMEVEE